MRYSDTIKNKPSIVFVNKLDIVEDNENLLQNIKKLNPIGISALTGENIDISINALANLIEENNK